METDNEKGSSESEGGAKAPTPDGSGTAAGAPLSGAELTKFNCLRNVAYHEARERHYAAMHRFMMFLVVMFGIFALAFEMLALGQDFTLTLLNTKSPHSGVGLFATLISYAAYLAPIATLIATTSGLSDLVFDLDGRARLHTNLRRRFFDFFARLESGENRDRLEAEMTRNYSDEPPTMHAVNALAFNAAVDALGRAPGQKYVLTIRQYLLRNWLPYEPNIFQTEDDLTHHKARRSTA